MNNKQPLLGILCSVLLIAISSTLSYGAGWCGYSNKEHCGGWVVQMNLFQGGTFDGGDCVSYNGCVTSAQWNWSNPGAWTQNLVEKEGFCGKNYRISNTKDFNVSYNGSFSNTYGNHRLAIVSWGKTADNCNWTTNNLYELYIHEKSFNEGTHTQAYNSWCTYKGKSPSCSGSRYELYDCGNQIIGRSIRCWRINSRTSGTTDIDCLWEAWRSVGVAPDVYYYFTEVGTEVGPNSGGQFNLNNPNMVRVAESSGSSSGGGGSSQIVNNGVYRLKNGWGGNYLSVGNNWDWANVKQDAGNGGQWSQQWVLEKVSGDIYRLRNRWTGRYLHQSQNNNNANVVAAPLNTTWGSQKWRLRKDGNIYRLESQWGSKYLTGHSNTAGSNVKVHNVNNSWGSQKWTLVYTGTTAREGTDEVSQVVDKKMNILQNTYSHTLTVSGKDFASVAVYGMNGSLQYKSDIPNSNYEINLSDMKQGVYIVKAYDLTGIASVQKFIRE